MTTWNEDDEWLAAAGAARFACAGLAALRGFASTQPLPLPWGAAIDASARAAQAARTVWNARRHEPAATLAHDAPDATTAALHAWRVADAADVRQLALDLVKAAAAAAAAAATLPTRSSWDTTLATLASQSYMRHNSCGSSDVLHIVWCSASQHIVDAACVRRVLEVWNHVWAAAPPQMTSGSKPSHIEIVWVLPHAATPVAAHEIRAATCRARDAGVRAQCLSWNALAMLPFRPNAHASSWPTTCSDDEDDPPSAVTTV